MPWLVWVFGYVAMMASPAVGILHFDGMTYLKQSLGTDFTDGPEADKNYIPLYADDDWRLVDKRALSALSRFKPLTSAFSRQRPLDDERRREARFAMMASRPFQRVRGAPLRYGKR